MEVFLSKSDFKLGLSCPTKLYYKKQKFPTALDGNEYMEMLADGGYMVGYLAQLLYPEGLEITGDLTEALKETYTYLQREKVTLFEPVIRSGDMIVRLDILIKNGKKLKLIEVKSKSFDSMKAQEYRQKGKKYFDSNWSEYLYDVAYQKMVLKEAFPDIEIECEMLMPDKAKVAVIDGMLSLFELRPPILAEGFKKPEISFIGTELQLASLRVHHTLEWVNVDNEVDALIPDCKKKAASLLAGLRKGERIITSIGIGCKDCEYTAIGIGHDKSGYEICWGASAEPKPHILDLAQLGNINKKDGIITELINQGKTSLFDIPIVALTKEDGSPYYNNRPLYQVTEKKEFLLSGFGEVIGSTQYPLFFIDFETSQMAFPYHADMRCYENVIFQYSCHVVSHSGADPKHHQWLNTESTFPNHQFARALMGLLGKTGTIFIWSKYEITQLRNILRTLIERDEDEELRLWVEQLLLDFESDGGRFIDLNKEALNYYFHPLMGGRTSIKVTLPAVLNATKSARIKGWLAENGLLGYDESGSIIDPYKLLPAENILDEQFQIRVKDGSGAMRAYQDMLYGLNKNRQEIKDIYIKTLLNYCFLDTLAMVIIWEHWNELHDSD